MFGKKLFLVGGALLIFLAVATAALAASPIKLYVNGREIQVDVPPQLVNGRTMVPIRWVAEALGARVDWDQANNLVTIATAAQERASSDARAELELLTSGLRAADSPRDLVERYAEALKSRNGALARAYLAPAIKDQIPPQVIGVSTPLGKVEIEEKGFLADKSQSFQLKAFYAPYGSNPPSLAFAQMLAVAGESGGRYVVKDIFILEDNTRGAFWEQPREVTSTLPEGTMVSRWARLDADGDGRENEIYLVYGNGYGYEGTGKYAVWRAGHLYPLGVEVARGNQTFTPPLTEVVRDINGDGRPEIEWSDWGADAGEMKIYAWDGQQFTTLFEVGADRIELVDLEEDSVLEIAVGNRPQVLAEPLYKLYRWQDGRYAELPGIFRRQQEGRYVPID